MAKKYKSKIITKIVVRWSGGKQPALTGYWNVQSLSREFPIHIDDYDTLLEGVPRKSRGNAFIEFYDGNNCILPYDPRIDIDDVDDYFRS